MAAKLSHFLEEIIVKRKKKKIEPIEDASYVQYVGKKNQVHF